MRPDAKHLKPARVSTGLKVLIGVLIALLLLLQFKLWIGDGSLAEVVRLGNEIAAQQEENERLRERNRVLSAEVEDLKQGFKAIEERARSELGMIREDEQFYQIVDEPETQTEP